MPLAGIGQKLYAGLADLAVRRLLCVSYGQGTGSANANLCSAAGFGNTLAGAAAVANPGCNNNWSTWGIGARTQWDVTKTFYLGVEVLYSELKSATTGTGSVISPAGLASYAFEVIVPGAVLNTSGRRDIRQD
jgi:hypothetical protein